MPQMTITEALAEIKTIGKRIDKKRDFVQQNIGRPGWMLDSLAKDGGSESLCARETQAHNDLLTRLESIRVRIQESNQKATLAIEGRVKSVAGWLAWRKDCAPKEQQFLNSMTAQLRGLRDKIAAAAPADKKTDPNYGMLAHISEADLSKKSEELEKILGDLDGKLSLFNATTTIEL